MIFDKAPKIEETQQLPLELLHDFEGYKTAMQEDSEEFRGLCESVKRHGIQFPLLVRPHPTIDGEYEIIFGHQLHRALLTLGEKTAPCTVRDMSNRDARTVTVNDTKN